MSTAETTDPRKKYILDRLTHLRPEVARQRVDDFFEIFDLLHQYASGYSMRRVEEDGVIVDGPEA